MILREVSSILVDADASRVYASLLPPGLEPDGRVTRVPNERLEIRAPNEHDVRAARAWFLLKAEGARTRVIHGVVREPATLRERFSRDGLLREVERELADIKERAEHPRP